jgi:hypothetical protein
MIESAEPPAVYEVGARVHLSTGETGPIVDRWAREDAPGFLYRVEIPNRTKYDLGGPTTTVVGLEHITGPAGPSEDA